MLFVLLLLLFLLFSGLVLLYEYRLPLGLVHPETFDSLFV